MENQRLIMIQYSLRLINLAIENDYVLYYRQSICRNIVWDCQCALMEWSTAKISDQQKQEFFNNDNLALAFTKQLLWIGQSAVSLNQPGFEHIKESDLNKIILL